MTDRLDDLVVDSANQAAVAAARAVAESPRLRYGPLVLAGPPGMGKTFLLQGIQARAGDLPGESMTVLITVADLQELARGANGAHAVSQVKDRLIRADWLLLDGFEAIGRSQELQGLVYEVLEARVAADRETVIAADAKLEEIPSLDPRLLRRIREGTVIEIGLPGVEARRQILRRRLAQMSTALPAPVSDAIAGLSLSSVREYLGALHRAVAFQQMSPEPLTARDVLLLLGVIEEEEAPVARPMAVATEPPSAPSASVEDEFGAFLSDVVANVSQQLDQWRGQILDAMARWKAAGFRTRRLEEALTSDLSSNPEPMLEAFARDVELLTAIATEAETLAPDLVGAAVFHDPDQLAEARALLDQARSRHVPLSSPLPDLQLAALGEGPSNRLALQAARSVVAAPGQKYNPLSIIGASGVGKTHLLHGIGNALIAQGIGPVACVSAHSLVGEIAAMATSDALAGWRSRVQWVGAFLLDDFHLLADEPRAQEELVQLFSALSEAGRPLAFTSAKRLSDLRGMDPRLLTRLEAGLVVDLLSPDRDVRLYVVKAVLSSTPFGQDAALADYLASRPAESVRAVQGAVQRVLVEAAAQRVNLTPAFAREVLDVVDLKPARAARRATANTSGIVSAGLGMIKSREKMLPEWPELGDLLIPELR